MNPVEEEMLKIVVEMGLEATFDPEHERQLLQQYPADTHPRLYRVGTGRPAGGGSKDCHIEFLVRENTSTIRLRRAGNLKYETWEYRPEIRHRIKDRIRDIIDANYAACAGLMEPHYSIGGTVLYKPFEFGQRVVRRRMHDPGALYSVKYHVNELSEPTHVGFVRKCESTKPHEWFVSISCDDGRIVDNIPAHELDKLELADDVYEIERLYTDWYGHCRTCLHWGGQREHPAEAGRCEKVESDLYKEKTTTDGRCDKYEPFESKIIPRLMNTWGQETKL